jgi:hypothetical protein
MRDELTAALQARWEESLADEATDGDDGVGEVEEGVDDFLAALVAALPGWIGAVSPFWAQGHGPGGRAAARRTGPTTVPAAMMGWRAQALP